MAETLTAAPIPAWALETLPSLPEGLFPLPLTAFEKYLIWDETPELPMSSFIELHFLDPLQVSTMEQAIAAAVKIHPLLVCRLQTVEGQLSWQHLPDFTHRLNDLSDCPPLPCGRPQAFDLSNHPGIRFWYGQPASGGSRVLIQLHHAVTDGVGLRRFLIDVLTLYALATAPHQTDSAIKLPWAKVDPSLLGRRDDFSDSFGCLPAQPLSFWQRLNNARYFHFHLPAPLNRPSSVREDEATSEATAEPLVHLVMDRQTSEAILEQARIQHVGINELALGLLFETSALWNQQHGGKGQRSHLRILMPYDLRARVDLRMPATNRMSFSFLGRSVQQCQELGPLVESIGKEIQAMKDSQLPLDFLAALKLAAGYPKLMKWAIGRSRNMATTVLTYAGDVSRGIQKYFPELSGSRLVGDVRLDKIVAAPPVRDNTHWSLGLCINWGQLCISAAWNRQVFSRQDCQQLMQLYQSRWLHWLNSN
jgi:hypothetical protein